MKYQEAFRMIKDDIEIANYKMKADTPSGKEHIEFIKAKSKECLDVLQQAIDKANKYDEKETPMKPEMLEDFDERSILYKTYLCGTCQNILSNTNSRYCPSCGQRLEFKNE